MSIPLPPYSSLPTRGNSLNNSPAYLNNFQTSQSPTNKGIGELIGKGHSRDNFAIFNDILQKAYQRMAFSPTLSGSESIEPEISGPESQKIPGYQSVEKI